MAGLWAVNGVRLRYSSYAWAGLLTDMCTVTEAVRGGGMWPNAVWRMDFGRIGCGRMEWLGRTGKAIGW